MLQVVTNAGSGTDSLWRSVLSETADADDLTVAGSVGVALGVALSGLDLAVSHASKLDWGLNLSLSTALFDGDGVLFELKGPELE